jgi:RNA polymerase sigma-70 factor (ECF subfamily)
MRRATESTTGQELTTTHWSEIQAARTLSPEHRSAVLNNLARRYWKPVYCYLRARGYNDAEARDITQDFFVEVVLGRDLFGQADAEKGRFRAYLLHCLKNFTRERHRREQARCRSPDRPVVSIDQWTDSHGARFEPPAPEASPEDAFHRRWAASLLEGVIDRLSTSCRQAGLEVHYTIFQERFVRPALEHAPTTGVEALAARFGLTPKQVANRGETVRRRFRSLLLDEVRLTVTDEAGAEDELRVLLGHLRG